MPGTRGSQNNLVIELFNARAFYVCGIQPCAESGLRQQRQFVRCIAAVEVGGWVLFGETKSLGFAKRIFATQALSQAVENEIGGAVHHAMQGADTAGLRNATNLLEH